MAQYDRTQPYNNLPMLPPKANVETADILKKCILANVALAEVRARDRLLPNQELLLRSVLLQEAKVSSEIENIVTTNDRLYRAMTIDPDRTDSATREVLRYSTALWHGYWAIRRGNPIRPSLITEIAQAILGSDVDVRSTEGCQIAQMPEHIPVYTPPVGKPLIQELINDLCRYMAEDEGTDPLIKMAVAHYQFEAIHPFSDGNGRTGRVLNVLYLVERGLLQLPVLYLSWYIVRNRLTYYERLRAVTEHGEWAEWILYMLDAVEESATMTLEKMLLIRELIDSSQQTARGKLGHRYKPEVVDLVFAQPYLRIENVVKSGLAQRATAAKYLKELEGIGLLQSFVIGRERVFLNSALIDALTLP